MKKGGYFYLYVAIASVKKRYRRYLKAYRILTELDQIARIPSQLLIPDVVSAVGDLRSPTSLNAEGLGGILGDRLTNSRACTLSSAG